MAVKDYFSEYANYISTLQNRIMNIQLRYNECQSCISKDYEKGFLSDTDFDRLYDCRMDELIDGYDYKYVLSPEEVADIQKYADLDSDGKVLSTLLQYKYLHKNDVLQSIFQSVRILAYYDSLDFLTKRTVFRNNVINYYSTLKRDCENDIQKLENVYGTNANSSSNYKDLKKELERINAALRFADTIPSLNDENFLKSVVSFYKIKYYYYEWYRKMELKDEYEKGFVYSEHCDAVDALQTEINSSISLQKKLKDDGTEALEISCDLSKFLEQFIKLNIEDILENNEKKGIFTRFRNSTDNKNLLFQVFCKLINLYGVDFYLENNFEIDVDGKRLDNNSIFNLYFKRYYGDCTFVDVDDFMSKFRKVVTSYYKKILVEYRKVLKSSDTKLNEENSKLINISLRSRSEARLINKIYTEYNGYENVSLNGFTIEETEAIYRSLNGYILNGFSFEDSDLIMKKV